MGVVGAIERYLANGRSCADCGGGITGGDIRRADDAGETYVLCAACRGDVEAAKASHGS